MHWVGHAVVQRIEIFTHMRREHELLTNHVQHVLLGLGAGQIGVQEVLTQVLGSVLQILDPESTDRLDDVVPHAP